MNTFETAIIIFMTAWLVLAIVNIPLTIWSARIRAKKQSENNTCIYFLYKELKRYNDSNEAKK